MVTLSNGHRLEVLVGSGALGYDGRGWPWEWPWRWASVLRPEEFTVVTKTLTFSPRRGNFRGYNLHKVFRSLGQGSYVNAIGLSNPGLKWWLAKCYPKIDSRVKIIVSIFPYDPEEASIMSTMLEEMAEDIVGIEVNASCPNTETDILENEQKVVGICKSAQQATYHPLILKISYLHSVDMVKEAEQYLEAVHAINTVPWQLVFPNRESPLAQYGGGGVSGPAIARFTREKVAELAGMVSLPILAGGGIQRWRDVLILEGLGASAFSIGSLFHYQPWQPNRIVRQYQQKL